MGSIVYNVQGPEFDSPHEPQSQTDRKTGTETL